MVGLLSTPGDAMESPFSSRMLFLSFGNMDCCVRVWCCELSYCLALGLLNKIDKLAKLHCFEGGTFYIPIPVEHQTVQAGSAELGPS
mmetsp:Transcript_17611/g.42868  ORF Transcript_17611/g.42868 Transcript_17611/m.42868 type:complete len:87 (+) Transcript_17611:1470-1730(+)